jgi:hypothetical protein
MVLADLQHAVRNNTPSFAQVRQAETQLALAREWPICSPPGTPADVVAVSWHRAPQPQGCRP